MSSYALNIDKQGVGRKIPRGWGSTKKTRPKNNTIKPPYTLSVSYMKIQRGEGVPIKIWLRVFLSG